MDLLVIRNLYFYCVLEAVVKPMCVVTCKNAHWIMDIFVGKTKCSVLGVVRTNFETEIVFKNYLNSTLELISTSVAKIENRLYIRSTSRRFSDRREDAKRDRQRTEVACICELFRSTRKNHSALVHF